MTRLFHEKQNENHLLESKPFTKCSSQESLLFCKKRKKQNGKHLRRPERRVVELVICTSTTPETPKHFKTTLSEFKVTHTSW